MISGFNLWIFSVSIFFPICISGFCHVFSPLLQSWIPLKQQNIAKLSQKKKPQQKNKWKSTSVSLNLLQILQILSDYTLCGLFLLGGKFFLLHVRKLVGSKELSHKALFLWLIFVWLDLHNLIIPLTIPQLGSQL